MLYFVRGYSERVPDDSCFRVKRKASPQSDGGESLNVKERWRALRVLSVELIIYGVLVTVYAVTVLRFLKEPLADLYHNDMTLYAVLCLLLIVGQGVFLEGVTSFLVDRLRLLRFE
jgi:hypothetical protein